MIASVFAAVSCSGAIAGEWRAHFGDAANSARSQVAGPSNPGLKWATRLSDMTASFAPAGYRVATNTQIDRPLIGPDGTLILVALNNQIQYQPFDGRVHRELIGINPENGNVIWEIGDASDDLWRCRPALDSQGRLWVFRPPERGDDNELWRLQAFDPATGAPIPQAILYRPSAHSCRRTQLHIGGEGANERLVMYGTGGNPEHFIAVDISGPVPTPSFGFQLGGGGSIAGVPLNSDQRRIGVFTDDFLIFGLQSANGQLGLIRFPLDSDNPVGEAQQMPMPTPPDQSSAAYFRIRMVATDNGNLLLSPHTRAGQGGAASFVAKVNLNEETMSTAWVQTLPGTINGVRDLTLVNDGVLVRTAGTGITARMLSVQTGEELWSGARAAARTISDTGHAASAGDTIFVDTFAARTATGWFYTLARDPGAARDELMASYNAADGAIRWTVRRESVAQAAGVDSPGDLGLGNFRSLQFGPISQDGTLYVTNNLSQLDGIIAIDNSGGLAD